MGPILPFIDLFEYSSLYIVSKVTFVNHLAEFVGNIYFYSYCYCLLLSEVYMNKDKTSEIIKDNNQLEFKFYFLES